MSTEHILTDLSDGILTIRLNRPEKKNALTHAMYTALADALKRADEDPAVRVALITGTPDCFCSGNDLEDFLNMPPASEEPPVLRFMKGMAGLSKPVIAALNGPAVGIGTTILFHVDLAYAGETTRFHLPFVNIGICPEYASTYLLPRMIGHPQAAELMLLAEPFTAAKALDCRLINAVLPDAEVYACARGKALRLAQQPPGALRTTKMLLRRWNLPTVNEAIVVEAERFMSMLKGPEALEALSAFMQKRKPDFSKFSA
jgi:enoyl-CoA hydratase/carnithine racemase